MTTRAKAFALATLVVLAAIPLTAWLRDDEPIYFRTAGLRTMECEDQAGRTVLVRLDFSDKGRTVAVRAGSLSAVLHFTSTRLMVESYTDGTTTLTVDPEIILSGPGIGRVGPCH